MLVYGDHSREERPRETLGLIVRDLDAAAAMPAGIERHGLVVAAFIALGELAQGLADRAFAERGVDARSATGDAVMRTLIELAGALGASWRSGFRELAPSPLAPLGRLQRLDWPETVSVRLPEGYVFYALYPEAYLKAAQALAGRPLRVIGLRSIGTSLVAAVAAGAGLRDAITLRPVGHPFSRSLALSDSLRREILSDPAAGFAVVDEGPGLSGSSFGCVADFLEDRGVDPRRIHFFPSHAQEPGAEASPRHRKRWAGAQRHFIGFEDLVLRAPDPRHRLESWVSEIVGEPTEPLLDISGGAWRRHLYPNEAGWPPANPQQERRKFILRSESGPWLLKFAGLGRYGAEKLAVSRELAASGFTVPAAAIRHGFLVEPWLGEATPLSRSGRPRSRLIEEIGGYLGFRARHLPAPRPGASLDGLWSMAARNAGLALGDRFAGGLDRWTARLPALSRHVVPIRGDNRLHAWEWLVVGGRLVKTDALDHHRSHDLVGCQDLAWDVAGACVEFALAPGERDRLCAAAEREGGRPLAPELVDFLTLCYLAFQLGSYQLAAQSMAHDPAEAARLESAAAAYAERLRRLLSEPAGDVAAFNKAAPAPLP